MASGDLFIKINGIWTLVGNVSNSGSGGGEGVTHSESLTDGFSNYIFANGDIVTVVGVPNWTDRVGIY